MAFSRQLAQFSNQVGHFSLQAEHTSSKIGAPEIKVKVVKLSQASYS